MEGGGNAWANEYRQEMPRDAYLMDLDGVQMMCGNPDNPLLISANTENRMFAQYVCDPWENRDNPVREFAFAALFEAKGDVRAAAAGCATIGRALGLKIARQLSIGQPIPCRYFVVYGEPKRWLLTEFETHTGKVLGHDLLIAGEWAKSWDYFGLRQARLELQVWLSSRYYAHKREAKT